MAELITAAELDRLAHEIERRKAEQRALCRPSKSAD
jgi:hypothetical protein